PRIAAAITLAIQIRAAVLRISGIAGVHSRAHRRNRLSDLPLTPRPPSSSPAGTGWRPLIEQATENARPLLTGRLENRQAIKRLLDLAFLEFDVLLHDRVVLTNDHLLGHGAGVLLGDVEEAGVRRGVEADLDGSRFGHRELPLRRRKPLK